MNNLQRMLYQPFQHWMDGKSLWFFSDTHFGDSDCLLMDKTWPSPEEQVEIINNIVPVNATLVLLGDVGNDADIWIGSIRAKNKVLVMGNHDQKSVCNIFDEAYRGPIFISLRRFCSVMSLFLDLISVSISMVTTMTQLIGLMNMALT